MIIGVLLAGIYFALPNVFAREGGANLPAWLPNDQINLGLDLQGGTYLLMEADIDAVLERDLENIADGLRTDLRAVGYKSIDHDGLLISVVLEDEDGVSLIRERLNQNQLDPTLAYYDISTDGPNVEITYTEQGLRNEVSRIMSQAVAVLRERIDQTGTREPSIQRQGERRILLQLPGVENPERIKEILQATAVLTFQFVDQNIIPGVNPIPATSEVLYAEEVTPAGDTVQVPYVVRKRTIVKGENLIDAQGTFQDNRPVVSFRFDSIGAKRFADATQKNVGRLFAIILDEKVISAPVIREPILTGNGVISGTFTTQEANDLALLLRAGALPAAMTFLEERTVGPGLGADSIRAGQIACILGMIFVVFFMAISYGLFGAIADVALICNLVLIMAVLSVLQATLTLPGIAGIVLTIGMAVDANVLIFERIREEARLGRGPVSAIDAGYKRALTTILDSNLTTLIAAFLLFFFGSGPVKGFAVTLSIGIITSMFTAMMVTRLLLVLWLRRTRPKMLPI